LRLLQGIKDGQLLGALAEGGASSGSTTSSMLKRSSYGFGKLTSRVTGKNAI
jgi:hypothetical protein